MLNKQPEKVMPKKDVVVVGLGWTGAIMSKELADAGLDVVALERGKHRPTSAEPYPSVADELAYVQRFKLFQRMKNNTVTIRYNLGETALPYRELGSFYLGTDVGGCGFHWNGMTWRTLPEDLKIRTMYTEKYGASFIPDDMTIQDYPMTYEELEPHFTMYEHVCGTSGQAGNINGKIIPGGNPFEAPRSGNYPNPPLQNLYGGILFKNASEKLGLHPFPLPASNASKPYTNPYGVRLGPCNYCGYCEDFGCYMYSKASPQTTILPALMPMPNFELRTESEVIKVNTDSSGKHATGVTYVDADGQLVFQPADMVLLCAFQVHNVKLLLVSEIGQPYNPLTGEGVVGKNFAYQFNINAPVYLKEGAQNNPFIGAGAAGSVIDDFNGLHFDHREANFIGGAYITAANSGGRPISQVPPSPNAPNWGKGWKQGKRDGYQRNLSVWAEGSVMSYKHIYIDLDPTYKDAWGIPLARMTFNWQDNEKRLGKYISEQLASICENIEGVETYSQNYPTGNWDIRIYQTTHITGGAITGDSPSNSVVNKFMQSWAVPNVFVYGACAFPQNMAYNPTGLIGALTYFSAQEIKARYLKNPGPLVI
ncbi:GMC family oxidoreductase [Wohlfahrtiimonas chitiniclastica]|uniref:GMC family oxidoreductase n=1 Tax=Wohlfahrtiimonas chitiniclastica TaxID=400946 RepID=UPI001BCCF1DA|nr:GMC family oxidoreductase [Wohlfahrtiimonas chitiniclastica]MBS7828010.1 GMC family oxidoreductase [Wohlfahrtiimonas chitiniclastica]